MEIATGRSYRDIVRDNLLTLLNVTLFGIGLVLVAMGLYRDALLSSGFALLNALIGIIQEAIAKHRLDQVALLARAQATAVRDGEETPVWTRPVSWSATSSSCAPVTRRCSMA